MVLIICDLSLAILYYGYIYYMIYTRKQYKKIIIN